MMEKSQNRTNDVLMHDSFTEKWFSDKMSLVTGLFQLEYDGAWHCVFAADECSRVLQCDKSIFFEELKNCTALTAYGESPETVEQILDEIAVTERSGAFISIISSNSEARRYVKGTLSAFKADDGLLRVYGQITDVSREQQPDTCSQNMVQQGEANQQIFHIVAQHSNRILYSYDLASGTTRPWDEENRKNDILAHLYTGNYTEDGLEKNEYVLNDSIEDVKTFFADIHSGKPSGEERVHIKLTTGEARWYHFKYSSIFQDGNPVTALISVRDVTEQHKHEMAYQRYVQSIGDDAEGYLIYIESDLTADRVEKLAGQFIPESERYVDCSHSDFGPMMLDLMYRYEDAEEAARYFSCENLLGQYAQGEKLLRSEWKTVFNDGTFHWLDTLVVLVKDPYNNHVKALISMFDVTERQEKHLSVLQRADFDEMTGLLRKDVGEARIREYMAAAGEHGGILIVIDLDDLKGINDNLGHKAGDAAIIGLADTLKSHFRKSDVVVRAGGDEFMVFLPEAERNVSSVKLSVSRLIQKVAGITVGEDNDRNIHCSAGCAVELKGTDTYDTLFKRADTALYHVKRTGKNNFAFYLPEMSDDDFQLKSRQIIQVVDELGKEEDIKYLLEVLTKHYPSIVHCNLSKNRFRLMSFSGEAKLPKSGAIHQLWQKWKEYIHPDDAEETVRILSREEMLSRYAEGEYRFVHYYRNVGSWGDVQMEVAVNFFRTVEGDVCAFLFFRRDVASGRDLELMRLQKMLEMTMDPDFEYVCLIDVESKKYSTFSKGRTNSHAVPETADFTLVTEHIRDTQIPPEERDSYYEKAALDNVITFMNSADETYSYRYTMTDGIEREAVFSWYEDTHFELLMTVRKLV